MFNDNDTPFSIPNGYGLEDLFHCKSIFCCWGGSGYELEKDGSCPVCKGKNLGIGLKKSEKFIKLIFIDDFKNFFINELKEYKKYLEKNGYLNKSEGEHSEETDEIHRSYSEVCEYLKKIV